MNHDVLVLLFESIPEAIVIISLGLSLYGENIKHFFKKIIFIAISYSVFTFFSRELVSIYHYRTLLNISALILIMMGFKIPPLKSVFAAMSGVLALLFAETILVFLIDIAGYSLDKLLLINPWMRIVLPLPHLFVLGLITIFLTNKNFSLLKVSNDFFYSNGSSKRISLYIAALLLIFLIILGVINVGVISDENNLGYFLSQQGIIVLTAFMAFDIYLLYKAIGRLFHISEQQHLLQIQEMYLKNTEEVMQILRSQRHDFINHLDVIYSLHVEQQYEEEKDYLEQMLGDIRKVNSIIRIDNPPLSSLLNTKHIVAENKGIDMKIAIETPTPLKALMVEAFDITKILGNILDNALDATEGTTRKIIEVEIRKQFNKYIFEVSNSGPPIKKEYLDLIFQAGFTTKGSNHQGLGLSIVKKLVEKYKGELKVESTVTRTVFTVVLPVSMVGGERQ